MALPSLGQLVYRKHSLGISMGSLKSHLVGPSSGNDFAGFVHLVHPQAPPTHPTTALPLTSRALFSWQPFPELDSSVWSPGVNLLLRSGLLPVATAWSDFLRHELGPSASSPPTLRDIH